MNINPQFGMPGRKLAIVSGLMLLIAGLLAAVVAMKPGLGSAEAKTPPASKCALRALPPKFYTKGQWKGRASSGVRVTNCGGVGFQATGYIWLAGEDSGRGNDVVLGGKDIIQPGYGDGTYWNPPRVCNEDADGSDELYTRIEWNATGSPDALQSRTIKVRCSG